MPATRSSIISWAARDSCSIRGVVAASFQLAYVLPGKLETCRHKTPGKSFRGPRTFLNFNRNVPVAPGCTAGNANGIGIFWDMAGDDTYRTQGGTTMGGA